MGVFDLRERMQRILSSFSKHHNEQALELQDVPPVEDNLQDWESPSLWTYAEEYNRNVGEGQQKPPPAFGCPTLVMHVGVWQKRQSDEDRSFDESTAVERKFGFFDEHNEKFVEEANRFFTSLQKLGRVLRKGESEDLISTRSCLKACSPPIVAGAVVRAAKKLTNSRTTNLSRCRLRCGGRIANPISSLFSTSASLILGSAPSGCASRFTPYGPRRYFVLYRRGETLWPPADILSSRGQGPGHRRPPPRISNYLRTIREVSAQQIAEGYVERDRLPERGVAAETGQELLEAADYLYDGVWRDFMTSFDIQDGALGGGGQKGGFRRGTVRGFPRCGDVGSGLDTPPNRVRASRAAELRSDLKVKEPENPRERNANVGVGQLNTFDFENNEPNTILKSLWPFLRRMTPWADYKDFVGCGLIGKRLIYVSPLGATGKFYADEEGPDRKADRSSVVPS